jgi:Ca-activated chloride channel homolog
MKSIRTIACGSVAAALACTTPMMAFLHAHTATTNSEESNSNTPPPAFKSGVNLVVLGLTVTDGRERPVPGLTRHNFAVMENGKPQEIAFFAAEPTPLDLVILMDTSGSMNDTIGTVQDAALDLAKALRPGDRVSFGEVKRGFRVLQPLSSDASGLETAVRGTTAGGQTSLFQGIYIALSDLRRAATPGEVRRQALVLLSDGEDTTSLIGFDEVLDVARRSGVSIYSVSLRSPDAWRNPHTIQMPVRNGVDGDFALNALATQTGGRAFFKLDQKTLPKTCQAIANELANQYAIGYVSNDAREDGRFRQVAVQVVNAEPARVRTRPGYYAGKSLPAPGTM